MTVTYGLKDTPRQQSALCFMSLTYRGTWQAELSLRTVRDARAHAVNRMDDKLHKICFDRDNAAASIVIS